MFSDHYIGWRQSRINTTLEFLGADFFTGKKLLEVGCGYADVSNILSKMISFQSMTVTEGNHNHIVEMKRRQQDGFLSSELNIVQHDSDKEMDANLGTFDIVIHWGLLYHLKDPKGHLSDLLRYTNYCILETEVCDSNEPICKNLYRAGYDQALNGIDSRPSPLYIENIFRDCNFEFKRLDVSQLNHEFHVYDWFPKNDETYRDGLRRFWIAWKKELPCPLIK